MNLRKDNARPKYRKDIDGLRALAVILVVVFHAFPEWLAGGFIGVDIFFVISGFLISSILLESLDKNRFSFKDFYLRRIRRIFPALILVLSFSLILGWFTLFPDEYRLLGQHVLSSAGFVQNFNLQSEIGYFDNAAETKPLLHLWSLGIEEQFYLIWPLMLWLVYRAKLNAIFLILIIGIGSFGLNLITSNTYPIFAFFSPYTRFWELLVGATLAYYSLRKSIAAPKYTSAIGLGLIIIGALSISPISTFPGWLALLPTIGSALIICARSDDLVNKYVLSNKWMVGLGLISYPLYLWHWVLLSFIRITESGEVTWEIRVILIAISIILSILTYQFIEKPIQSKNLTLRNNFWLIILMAVIALVGYNFFYRDGLSFRSIATKNTISVNIPQEDEADAKRQTGYIDGFTCKYYEEQCRPLITGKKKILVWGDSHAQMLAYGLKRNMPSDWQFLLITQPGCQPAVLAGTDGINDDCARINLFASELIERDPPDVVLLAQRDQWKPSNTELIYEKLRNMGVKKVLYLGKSPEWTAKLPKIIARKSWHDIPRYSKAGLNLKAIEQDKFALENFKSTPEKQYINLIDLLCDASGCLVYLGDDVRTGITSQDTNHLTPITSDYVAKELLIKYLQ
jgi:peptidoglycan/LPS O-acetylase OafA/YrhL